MAKKSLLGAAPLALIPFGVLFLLGSRRKPGELPPTRLPATVDPMRDPMLFHPPVADTADDVLFNNWIGDKKSGAPKLSTIDLNPKAQARKLTEFERWALRPYFYVDDLTVPVLHNSARPKELEDYMLGPEVIALTIGHDIYFPHEPKGFVNRWWLGALAHELYHAGQYRLGLQKEEGIDAVKRWGYYDNPLEVSARWKQREVFDGLTSRARAFYSNVKPGV